MLLIYGVELYGKALLPLGSVCILGREPGQTHMSKVELPLHGLSVITAYMRTWAPVVGLLLLKENLFLSAILLGLYLFSWFWDGVGDQRSVHAPPGEAPPRGVGLSASGGERSSQPVALPRARADKSERERQRVEALFQKLRPQLQEPPEEEQAEARAQPAPAPARQQK